MPEYLDTHMTPEDELGLKLNNLVGINFLPGFRGRIKEFRYNESGERVALVKNPNGEDFTARLDQLEKIED